MASIERFFIKTNKKPTDSGIVESATSSCTKEIPPISIHVRPDGSSADNRTCDDEQPTGSKLDSGWEIRAVDNLTNSILENVEDINLDADDLVFYLDENEANNNSTSQHSVTAMSLGSENEQEDCEGKAQNSAKTAQNCDENENLVIVESEASAKKSTKGKKTYKQKFRHEWADQFPWAEKSGEEASCKICKFNVTGSSFHLRRHEKTTKHIQKSRAIVQTQRLEKVADSMRKRLVSKLLTTEVEWKLVCYLCEHNLPFRLMDTLPEFCTKAFPDSSLAKTVKIKRKKANQIVVGVLAPYAQQIVIGKLRTTKFSLIIDETTDVSTKKSLVVIARFWDGDEVKDRFLDLIEVESATADGIFKCIKQILDHHQIPYKNIIGFAADNANVMMGNRASVRTKLAEIAPNMVVQGCSCHLFHLCASHACLKIPNTIEQFARDIYSYFSNSSKRLEELHECQVFVDEKPHKMLYPSQTRWLSLQMVITRILEHWNSLTLYFQKAAILDNLPTASAILNALRNPIYRIYLLFLSYVTGLLTRLNLEFQSESPKLPLILEKVTALYILILKSFVNKSVINSTRPTQIAIDNPKIFKPLEEIYVGAKADAFLKDSNVNIDPKDLKSFRLHVLEFYIDLAKQIKKRFDFDSPHLKFASNFTVKNALSGDISSIAECVNFYPELEVDIELANIEWQLLPESFALKDYEKHDVIEFWKMVNRTRNNAGDFCFENVMTVVRYVLSLPHSSAAAERAFSQLSLIKSKLRNKLFVTTCAAILNVKDAIRNKEIGYNNLPVEEILKSVEARGTTSESTRDKTRDAATNIECLIEEVNVPEDLFLGDS